MGHMNPQPRVQPGISQGDQSRGEQPTGVSGFSAGERQRQQQHPAPSAHVSTTRIRGMGLLGLGGLDILTLKESRER